MSETHFLKNDSISSDDILEIILLNIKENIYFKEETDDELFFKIKNLCFLYLNNSTNINNVSNEELLLIFNFLIRKFIETHNLKKNLKIKNYFWPFTEITQSLDEYMLSEDIYKNTIDTIYIKITKDINNTLDYLGFCYGIINKIKQERNLN